MLYTDHPSHALSIEAVRELLEKLGLKILIRGNLISYLNLSENELIELAENNSGSIITDINMPTIHVISPSLFETKLEQKRMLGENEYRGVFYDGLWLQRILYRLLSQKTPDEMQSGNIIMIFTSRLFGTFEEKRYHARVILMGMPTLISSWKDRQGPGNTTFLKLDLFKPIRISVNLTRFITADLSNMTIQELLQYSPPMHYNQ
jgi:hypothetical protein